MSSYIHPTAIIHDNVILEEDVYIGPNCIIGFPPEDRNIFPNIPFSVYIAQGAKITGNITIDAGTIKNTYIGSNSFLMKGVHIGHDVEIAEDVTISCHSIVGGHTKILKGANLGLGCIIHPRQNIQPYCMLGMGAIIPKKLITEPFGIYVGNPAKKIGINQRGIEKNNISEAEIENYIRQFKMSK